MDYNVWYFKPYAEDKDLGKAYNRYCEMVPDGDWICLMDGDCMFLRSDYGHIVRRYIDAYPDCALFMPVTNRVGKGSHCYKGKRSENPDMSYHKKIADAVSGSTAVKSMDHVRWPSMPCFIFSKESWKRVGGFDQTGQILGVDVRFSKKIMALGHAYRMEGLYLLHYYRLNEGYKSLAHVK